MGGFYIRPMQTLNLKCFIKTNAPVFNGLSDENRGVLLYSNERI